MPSSNKTQTVIIHDKAMYDACGFGDVQNDNNYSYK